MEWKIGEIKQVNGEWYQCIEQPEKYDKTVCDLCDFHDIGNCELDRCSGTYRSDKKSIIFKKLKKVKEIDGNNGTFQTYKLEVPLCGGIPEEVTGFTSAEVVINVKNKEDMEEKKVKLSQEEYDYIRKKIKVVILPGNLADDVDSDDLGSEIMKLFSIDPKLSNPENPGKNLKPFNLEEAKAGKPVCTRDGRKARIICFDAKGKQPIIALFEKEKADEVIIQTYNDDGSYYGLGKEDNRDLMMLPEKKEGWINVYRSQIHNTLKSAEEGHKGITDYIETIKVEWEE